MPERVLWETIKRALLMVVSAIDRYLEATKPAA